MMVEETYWEVVVDSALVSQRGFLRAASVTTNRCRDPKAQRAPDNKRKLATEHRPQKRPCDCTSTSRTEHDHVHQTQLQHLYEVAY